MKNTKIINVAVLLEGVNSNKSGIFNKESELIAVLPKDIALTIGDNRIHISEFIIAKIKGLIVGNNGHPEITEDIFIKLPESLSNPFKIYEDNRVLNRNKYIFIKLDPDHQIIIEIFRPESGRTEINTIIPLVLRKRKQLEKNLKAVFP